MMGPLKFHLFAEVSKQAPSRGEVSDPYGEMTA